MNIANIVDLRRIGGALRRFPESVAFAAILTVAVMVINHDYSSISSDMRFFTTYYPATALMLSVSLRLWAEECGGRHRLARVAVMLLAHAVWLAGACYTSFGPMSAMKVCAAIAANVAVGLSVVLVPFWRERNDVAMWNFTLRMLIAMAVSWVIGLALTGALCLLFKAYEVLFGCELSSLIYSDTTTVCCLLVSPLLMLQMVPDGNEKHNREVVELTGVGKGVVNFLLLPVAGVYMLTLYAYAIKIIVQWQLPNGWVSYLVTVLAALMLLVEVVLYPTLTADKCSRVAKAAARWLPAMVLPLLMLMTVGAARRLGDYGVTVLRLYLVVLNVWLYAVCIGLLISRRRIWWIPASFAALLLLTSIGPQSIANVTLITLQRQVEQTIAQGHQSMPLNRQSYSQLLAALPKSQAALLDSRLAYIKDTYGPKATEPFAEADVAPGRRAEKYVPTATIPATNVNSLSATSMLSSAADSLPQGYRYATMIDGSQGWIKLDAHELQDQGVVRVSLKGRNGNMVELSARLNSVAKVANIPDSDPSRHLMFYGPGAALMVDDIDLDGNMPSVMLRGILLEK